MTKRADAAAVVIPTKEGSLEIDFVETLLLHSAEIDFVEPLRWVSSELRS